MNTTATQRRNLTPPEVAKRLGVSVKKIIAWIRAGELQAMNLANRDCSRPRYRVTLDALEAFERSRLVVPEDNGPAVQQTRRRPANGEVKQFI